MTILNSADLRNNLSEILELVASKKKPVYIGRFGQPKAVLMDLVTYNWQKQVFQYLQRLNTLTPSEIETLNILLDEKTRNSLLLGLGEIKSGEVVSAVKKSHTSAGRKIIRRI